MENKAKRVKIVGGRVVDGTGASAFDADIIVEGDRIVSLIPRVDPSTTTAPNEIEDVVVVDAGGCIVCPGFIDSHTHDDLLLLDRNHRDAKSKLSQGVTTVVVGNCGMSLFPLVLNEHPELEKVPEPLNLLGPREAFRFPSLQSFLDAIHKAEEGTRKESEAEDWGAVVNYCILVGHGALRLRGMKYDHDAVLNRSATKEEIEDMKVWLEEAMKAGAIGMSTGLQYPLANAASTEEVIELARVVAKYGGIYATHIRDESKFLEESVEEAIHIGKEVGVEVILSHHKAAGNEWHGKVVQTLKMVDEVNAQEREKTTEGQERERVSLDVYPYTASSTILRYEFALKSPTLITWSHGDPKATGKYLADIAEEKGVSLREAIEALQPAGAVYFSMSEEDVRRVIRHPMSMIGSDGLIGQSHPHPRLWGTFPRVLGYYCRQEKVLSLEEAIRKMSFLPAQRYGLKDRGVIREGAYADVVIFNPSTVHDTATYADPLIPATGIKAVIVNGHVAYENKEEGSPSSPDAICVQHFVGRHLRRDL